MCRYDFFRVGIGGAVGACLRWLVIENTTTHMFPWPTLLINLFGCAALGMLIARNKNRETLLTWGAGLCGGLTTFSTFSLEIAILFRDNEIFIPLFYLFISVLVGILLFKSALKACGEKR